MKLPTRLDRYPAKMVTRLADHLIESYAAGARRILDPFCGSGAVLIAAHSKGIPVTGVDINPISALLSQVKLNGFDSIRAKEIANEWIGKAKLLKDGLSINWLAKDYWFTPVTLSKFERLRAASQELYLTESNEGISLILSYVLSIRLCSKADQRSPKPFISKHAKSTRAGKHFDPYNTVIQMLDDLSRLYGQNRNDLGSSFYFADLTNERSLAERIGKHSHVITSPPYINAQDYFRNFKLELYLLDGILPFSIDKIKYKFIGTERGRLADHIPSNILKNHYDIVPGLKELEMKDVRRAAIVHRYFHDMSAAFDSIRECLEPYGSLVLVCGDNLIGGLHIRTWQVLHHFLEQRGFRLVDQFSDRIKDRLLAPKRLGHKGLIKEENVAFFQLIGNN